MSRQANYADCICSCSFLFISVCRALIAFNTIKAPRNTPSRKNCTLFRLCCVQDIFDEVKRSTQARAGSVQQMAARLASSAAKTEAPSRETSGKPILRHEYVTAIEASPANRTHRFPAWFLIPCPAAGWAQSSHTHTRARARARSFRLPSVS